MRIVPAILTHYICGDQMLQCLKNQGLKKLLTDHRQVFNFGTQGADILYFCNILPWESNFGQKLHKISLSIFIKNAMNYIMKQEENDRNLLVAYLCGYVSHYALDSTTHPYIYYKAGFEKHDKLSSFKYRYYHYKFEYIIDILLFDEMIKIKLSNLNPKQLINVSKSEMSAVSRMYKNIIYDIFKEKISEKQISNSINNIITIESFLYKILLKTTYLVNLNKNANLFNMEHSLWFTPWDNTKKSTLSFIEMFEESIQEAKVICESIYRESRGQESRGQVP